MTMQMGLQDKYTPETKEAWIKMCKIITQAMISDNYLKSSTYDEEVENGEENDELDDEKIQLVQESW